MISVKVTCDECKKEINQTDLAWASHISFGMVDKIPVLFLSPMRQNDPVQDSAHNHYCSQYCGIVAVNKWMGQRTIKELTAKETENVQSV